MSGKSAKRKRSSSSSSGSGRKHVPSITVREPQTPEAPISKRPRQAFDTASPGTLQAAADAPNTPRAAPVTATTTSGFFKSFPTKGGPPSQSQPEIPPHVASRLANINNQFTLAESIELDMHRQHERGVRKGFWDFAKRAAAKQGTTKKEWEEVLLETPGRPVRFIRRVPVWLEDQVEQRLGKGTGTDFDVEVEEAPSREESVAASDRDEDGEEEEENKDED